MSEEGSRKNIEVIKGLLPMLFLGLAFLFSVGLFRGADDYQVAFLEEKVFEKVDGLILKSRIDWHIGANKFGALIYNAKISYSFKAGGKSIMSERVSLFDDGLLKSSKKENVQRVVNEFQANQKVTVYYEKGHPSFSVLKLDGKGDLYDYLLDLIILVAFFLICGVISFYYNQKKGISNIW